MLQTQVCQLFSCGGHLNPILHTWFRDKCFTCDGFLTIQVFHLLFNKYGSG
jgi:hypothetical protein